MSPIVIICSTLPPIVSTKQHLSFVYTDIGIDSIEWLKAYALEFSLGSNTYCTKNSASLYTSVKSNGGDQVLSEVEKNSFIALPGKESTAESCLEKQYVSQPRRIWAGKEAACNGGDVDSISGLGRSTGEGKGYPLQYSGLENSMDCLVHGVTKSQRWLNDFHFIAICQRWVADEMRVCAGSQFSSVTQSCPTLCDLMNCSTPSFPVHHQLLEFTQTHVHRVGHAIQPSHPLLSPSPPAPNPSQNQGLFQWVNSLHEVAKLLEFQLQHQTIQWALRTGLL